MAREMTAKLAQSEMFVLLGKRRRRLILQILLESSTPLTVREGAEHVAEYESENPSAEEYRRVYLALYHNHLPQLADADVVVFDRDEEIIRPSLNFDELIRVLERVSERDLPWSDS